MELFTNWFNSLTSLQQIFACVAIPATVILVNQTILLLFGFGEHDADHDMDVGHHGDIDHGHDGADHGDGVRIFTVRGLVAMFAVGGWLGMAAVDLKANDLVASIVAIVSGLGALLLVAFLLKLMLNMQETGNLDPKNAVAHTAKVYIKIPASRKGVGKVTFTLQDRFVEMDAVTDYDSDIKSDTMVQIVSVSDNVLVVRPLNVS